MHVSLNKLQGIVKHRETGALQSVHGAAKSDMTE